MDKENEIAHAQVKEIVEVAHNIDLKPKLDQTVLVSFIDDHPCRVLAHFDNGDLLVSPINLCVSAYDGGWGEQFTRDGWDARM